MVNFTPEEYAAVIAEDQTAFMEEVFLQLNPSTPYLPNWHVGCVVEHLRAVELGQIQSLIINEPPRMMKSIKVSIGWPAWLLGHNPSTQIIVASFANDIGTELSRKTLSVLNSPAYKAAFPSTVLDKQTEDWVTTTAMGHRYVATNGKSPIGFGADYIIIDDPINPMESLSDTVRKKTNDWITSSLFPRANNLNTVKKVMIMQRLHADDPTGHLLKDGGWHHLCLPVEFKKKTFIEVNGKSWTKEAGDWLHPERIDAATISKMAKEGMTPYQIAGQYYQSPTPPDGGDFKAHWLQYHDTHDCKGMNVYILFDPAGEKKKTSGHDPDYSVMVVIGLAPDNNYYLLDMVRDRLNPHERVETLIRLHKKWNARSGKPPKVGCEKYGMMTDAFYIAKMQKDINYRFPLFELGGQMKKEDRIRRLIGPFSEMRVYLPKSIPYTTLTGERVDLTKEFITEYDTFPVGRHDDIMDAFARITDDKLAATFPRLDEDVSYIRGGSNGDDDFNKDDWRTW